MLDIQYNISYTFRRNTYEKATLKKFSGRKAIGPLNWQPATKMVAAVFFSLTSLTEVM